MPHITLADGDVLKDHLPDVVHLLSARAFGWEIEVTNLSLIYDTGTSQGVRLRFDLPSDTG
jgi:2'-5' RNA ligase